MNHRARDLLRECLLSLRRHPYNGGPMEVVVLDNASGDGSLDMLSADFPEVAVLAESQRRGFGANQNRAIAASHGDLVFILNPDSVVHEGTIDRLVASLDWDPRIAAAGGPTINADGSFRQNRLHDFHTPFSPYAKAMGLSRIRSSRPMERGATADGWPSGGACLVRRDVFDELGGFDERYFMYAEDADLAASLVRRHYLVAWVDDAVVTHPFPTESATASARREAEKVRSELRYIRKHYGQLGEQLYRAGMVVDAASRVALLSIPGLTRLVRRHGKSTGEARRRHQARLENALSPYKNPGLAELAVGWNRQHPPPGGNNDPAGPRTEA